MGRRIIHTIATVIQAGVLGLAFMPAIPAWADSPGPALVSLGDNNTLPNGRTRSATITPDGRYVAFASYATNLVPGFVPQTGTDTAQYQAFVHDRTTGSTVLASVSNSGVTADEASGAGPMSSDGRYVLFGSSAHNLGLSNSSSSSHCYIRDLQQHTTSLVPATNQISGGCPAISTDGNIVAYGGYLSDGWPGYTCPSFPCNWNNPNGYIVNRGTGIITPIAIDSNGNYGAVSGSLWTSYQSTNITMSGDGNLTAFLSTSALMPGQSAGIWRLYTRNMTTNALQLIAPPISGDLMNSARPQLSADGHYLLYATLHSNGSPSHTYVRNLQTGVDTMVDVASGGGQANGPSFENAISSDGTYVAFRSEATNLVPGGSSTGDHMFVRNMQTGVTTQADVNSSGQQGNSDSDSPVIADNGQTAFYSNATNLTSDNVPAPQIYLSAPTDHTAPTITYTVTPVADSNGYNTGNVTVAFTCTDNAGGSGVASCPSPVTVDNEGVGHTVDVTATDNAGNSTTIHANASLLVQAIDAGGGATGSYSADTGFNGGQSYSSSAAVDTNGAIVPAPQAIYQTVRYGNSMSYTLSGLVPNANYTLGLNFNELYWGTSLANGGGAGSRVFNVAVNDQPALTNFDIYQTAGGANKAVNEQVPATADANGNITVQFSTVTDNAMVSGIALYKGTLPPQAPAPLPAPNLLINAGGLAVGDYAADTGYSGGSTYTSAASVDMSGAFSPAPEAVYQSVRYGNFTYTIPNLTPNKNYAVRLHFNELYWGTNASGGAGSRVFNVSINGRQVLSNFDVYQTAGGANRAIEEEFDVPADSDGKLTMQFAAVTDNAMVSGIEIEEI